MAEVKRDTLKFILRGINLAADPALLPPGDYPYLLNVTSVRQGEVLSRPGQMPIIAQTVGQEIHSIRRLNNLIPGAPTPYSIVAGIDNDLYIGQSALLPIDSGYSGDPLSMVRFRPDQSPESYLYIGDSLKMRKVNTEGVVSNVGIAAPITPPVADITSLPYYNFIDVGTTGGPWVNSGIAGSVSAVSRITINPTNINAMIYDVGTTGWCNIVPSTYTENDWIQPGAIVTLNNGTQNENVVIEQVFPQCANNFLRAIQYDSGTTGPCSVVMSLPALGVQRNSILFMNLGQPNFEAIVVESVSVGPDGLYSVRADLFKAHISGEPIIGLPSFRTHTIFTYNSPDPITSSTLQTTFSGTGVGKITRQVTIDLSSIVGRPTQSDDYLHISLKLDAPSNLVAGRVMLDVDGNNDPASQFTRNYYFKEFRPNDFQAAASGSQTVIQSSQTAIANQIIEGANPPYTSADAFINQDSGGYSNQNNQSSGVESTQLNTGANQWTELFFRVSDLQRVGADLSRNLSNVQAIAIQLTTNGSVTLQNAAFWIGGTYGPDIIPGSPRGLVYRYRYRSTITGAKSIPGPATRYELYPSRQQVTIRATPSPDPQVDVIDFERLDPQLQDTSGNPRWVYVGTTPNAGGTTPNTGAVLQDNLVAELIKSNPPLELTAIQPFPVLGTPIIGTCNVVGTSVIWVSGNTFPLNLLQDTVIRINNTAYQVYSTPTSTTFLSLTGSAGSQVGVPFEISSPILAGTPLPFIFGPLEGPTSVFMFGIGDPLNPGTIYFTNGNDLDSASDKNTVEVTPPSEPLISGAVWGTYVFVGSKDRIFLGQPTFDQPNLFTFIELPSSSGVQSMWGMKPGIDGVYYIGRDGVYRVTPFQAAVNIGADLWPLFPHEGQEAIAPANGLYPVLFDDWQHLRISIADGDVYFDYVDLNGVKQTLKYSGFTKGWLPYNYSDGANFHYLEEVPTGTTPRLLQGTSIGFIMASDTSDPFTQTDNGTTIDCAIQTPYMQTNDTRAQKLYVDVMTEFEGVINTHILYNWGAISLIPTVSSLTSYVRSQLYQPIAPTGDLDLYNNIAVLYTFSSGTALYVCEPQYYIQPFLTNSIRTQLTNHGIPGWKIERFLKLTMINPGLVTLTIQNDDGMQWVYTFNGTTPLNPLLSTQSGVKANYQNLAFNLKGKMFTYTLSSPVTFAPFLDECTIRIKKMGGERFIELPFLS